MDTLHVEAEATEPEEEYRLLSFEDIAAKLADLEEHSEEFRRQRQEIEDYSRERRHVTGHLSKIKEIDVELSKLFHLRFFKVRFGKMPKSTEMCIRDRLDISVFHNDNPGAHRHRLRLVVSYVYNCRLELLVQLNDFGTHLCAELRIQVGTRLVHEAYFWFAHDGTSPCCLLYTSRCV